MAVRRAATSFELRPEVGDHLTVNLAAIDKKATKTLKRWQVVLKRKDGETREIDQTDTA